MAYTAIMKITGLFVIALFLAACHQTPQTPLTRAAYDGSSAEVKSALAGAKPEEANEALVWAARNGNRAAIPVLVAGGANPNHTYGVNSWTPLEHAIHKDQYGSVKTLIDSGANINNRDRHGRTALMMAAGYGYADIVELMLDRGADPRVGDEDGVTALDRAVVGTPDIDRFTVGQCQTSTVQALLTKTPDLALDDKVWRRIAVKMKHCPDVENLLVRTRAAASKAGVPHS
jgi:hypothetical protein